MVDERWERSGAAGSAVDTGAIYKGYDNGRIYDRCEAGDCRTVIPLRQTIAVERGEWRFSGPTTAARRPSRAPDRRVHARLGLDQGGLAASADPRETPRWTALYRRRAAVEREFGRLKNEWSLTPLRVRGLDRVRLHADLTILAKLACALSRARAVPFAA